MNAHTSLIRREFKQTLRSKTALILLGVGVLLAYGMLRQYGIGGPNGKDTPVLLDVLGGETTLAVAQSATSPFVIVTGLFLGYRAISQERNRSLAVTASMPHSRLNLLLGKVIGRWFVVLLVTAVPVLSVLVAGSLWYGVPAPTRTVAFLVVTASYALSCVALGVGISALTRSYSVTAFFTFFFLILTFFWQTVLSRLIYTRVTGSAVPSAGISEDYPTGGYLLFQRLVPDGQYNAVTNAIIGAPNTPSNAGPSVIAAEPDHTVLHIYVLDDVFRSTPFYLAGEFGLVGIVAWAVIPLGLGYARFRGEDVQ